MRGTDAFFDARGMYVCMCVFEGGGRWKQPIFWMRVADLAGVGNRRKPGQR